MTHPTFCKVLPLFSKFSDFLDVRYYYYYYHVFYIPWKSLNAGPQRCELDISTGRRRKPESKSDFCLIKPSPFTSTSQTMPFIHILCEIYYLVVFSHQKVIFLPNLGTFSYLRRKIYHLDNFYMQLFSMEIMFWRYFYMFVFNQAPQSEPCRTFQFSHRLSLRRRSVLLPWEGKTDPGVPASHLG